ncbi:ABC transporter permease [Bifidobacterium panos]|uniref:ABC transporter permease n=1 Tax=Bifidobacterium panos TaxID=2675321 RepID=A0ABX1SUE9_9BIFI|nr:ABC transporter permease [Bifidobacterium sp. DSM 109963]NMN01445.1 ABC transporter permease [Bifidobacterium sp. DSM 109963]
MFVLKNAWRSVVRNLGRNILIAIIVAVIAAAATIGLAIRNSAETARRDGLNSTTVTATIGLDRDKVMQQAQQGTSSGSNDKPDVDSMREALNQDALTVSEYDKYAKASSVPVTTYYTETTSVNATDNFQPVESSSSASTDSSTQSGNSDSSGSTGNAPGGQPGGEGGENGSGGGPGGMDSGDFSLVGFSSDTAVANAANGTFTMSSGEVFDYESDGKAIISQALAQFNGLNVGDTIEVADLSGSDTTYQLTIVGIYKNTSSSDANARGPKSGTSSDADNAIYTSVNTLKKLGLAVDESSSSDSSSSSSSSATSASRTQLSYSYVLASKSDYDTFTTDLKKAGLDDNYTVSSADVENYETSLIPLDNLAKFALTLLIIVLAVGAAVLIVINLFNVRERKYEIGVLTAIGITKVKVVAQFVTELLIVTMIGIALGVAGGAVASVPVSNQLLAQQVASQQSQQSDRQAQFGRNADMPDAPGASGSNENSSSASSSDKPSTDGKPGNDDQRGFGKAANYVSEINATVSFKVIGELIAIGLALTLISALVGVIAIVRYEPLQILADRS